VERVYGALGQLAAGGLFDVPRKGAIPSRLRDYWMARRPDWPRDTSRRVCSSYMTSSTAAAKGAARSAKVGAPGDVDALEIRRCDCQSCRWTFRSDAEYRQAREPDFSQGKVPRRLDGARGE